jgi:hypothetical protein
MVDRLAYGARGDGNGCGTGTGCNERSTDKTGAVARVVDRLVDRHNQWIVRPSTPGQADMPRPPLRRRSLHQPTTIDLTS